MNENEYLYNELSNMDNLEPLKGGQEIKSMGGKLGVTPVVGNPQFTSQFDINISIIYVQSGAIVTPDNIPSEAKTDLPVFLFGQADFNGGYKNNFNRLRYNYFQNAGFKVYGGNSYIESQYNNVFAKVDVDVIRTKLQAGDVVIHYKHELKADTLSCFVIINSKQVAYGTLLDSSGSDRFLINMIRYTIADTSKLAQYEKQLQFIEQSLFGKQSNDFVSPASYKLPSQFQSNLIDIPTSYGISKHTSIATYLNYDVGEILLSIFVSSQKKIE